MIDSELLFFLWMYYCWTIEIEIVAFYELGTIAKGAELLHHEGAREVYACSTHAVFRYLFFSETLGNLIAIEYANVVVLETSKIF